MAVTSIPKSFAVRNVIDAGTAGKTKTYRVSIGPLKSTANAQACFDISELLAVNLEHPTIRVERTTVDVLEQV